MRVEDFEEEDLTMKESFMLDGVLQERFSKSRVYCMVLMSEYLSGCLQIRDNRARAEFFCVIIDVFSKTLAKLKEAPPPRLTCTDAAEVSLHSSKKDVC